MRRRRARQDPNRDDEGPSGAPGSSSAVYISQLLSTFFEINLAGLSFETYNHPKSNL